MADTAAWHDRSSVPSTLDYLMSSLHTSVLIRKTIGFSKLLEHSTRDSDYNWKYSISENDMSELYFYIFSGKTSQFEWAKHIAVDITKPDIICRLSLRIYCRDIKTVTSFGGAWAERHCGKWRNRNTCGSKRLPATRPPKEDQEQFISGSKMGELGRLTRFRAINANLLTCSPLVKYHHCETNCSSQLHS